MERQSIVSKSSKRIAVNKHLIHFFVCSRNGHSLIVSRKDNNVETRLIIENITTVLMLKHGACLIAALSGPSHGTPLPVYNERRFGFLQRRNFIAFLSLDKVQLTGLTQTQQF